MKKVVLKLDLHHDKCKKKAMKTASGLCGVDSVSLDKEKLTLTGDIDAVVAVKKLRKVCNTEIVSVGPAKEPEKKKEEPKKEEQKKPAEKKDPSKETIICQCPVGCPPSYCFPAHDYYPCARVVEQQPAACVIC